MGAIMESSTEIEGVSIKPLEPIMDERGGVFHVLRNDDPVFKQFGETYCSLVNSGVVKAWKFHSKMTQNMSVPVGTLKFVIYDARKDSSSFGKLEEIITGPDNYALITIPSGVWYGFKNIATDAALIVNCASLAYEPGEAKNLPEDSDQIPFDWSL